MKLQGWAAVGRESLWVTRRAGLLTGQASLDTPTPAVTSQQYFQYILYIVQWKKYVKLSMTTWRDQHNCYILYILKRLRIGHTRFLYGYHLLGTPQLPFLVCSENPQSNIRMHNILSATLYAIWYRREWPRISNWTNFLINKTEAFRAVWASCGHQGTEDEALHRKPSDFFFNKVICTSRDPRSFFPEA